MTMKKIRKMGMILCIAVLLGSVAGCQQKRENQNTQKNTQENSQESETKAPDFTVQLANGDTFTLSEQEGKVVLLNFWATWCSPCVEEMPALQKIHEEYGDQVKVVAVDCGEEKEVVDSFLGEKDYTFSVGYDEKNEISGKYPSNGIPYTLIIGKDGTVTKTFTGSYGAEEQYKLYRNALKEAVSQ